MVIDAKHIQRQIDFSRETFGPGNRTEGVIDHIKKELKEIKQNPTDLKEWVDIIILALDGAWRAGWEPQEIIDAIIDKQRENERRTWPDWRTAEPGKAIEHVREETIGENKTARIAMAVALGNLYDVPYTDILEVYEREYDRNSQR